MSLGSITCWENRNHNPSVFKSFYGAVPASMFLISLKTQQSTNMFLSLPYIPLGSPGRK